MYENGFTPGANGIDSARQSMVDYNKILKSKPGTMLLKKPRYNADVHEIDQPKTMLSNYDYIKRMSFHKQDLLQIDSMCKWKKKDFKGMKKRLYINEIKKVND